MGAPLTIPAGKNKGVPLEEADEADILYWGKRKSAELRADPNGRFAGSSRAWVEAARQVLTSRGLDASELDAPPPANGNGGGAPRSNGAAQGARPPASERTAPKVPDVMTFHNAAEMLATLDRIAEDFNLVGSVSVGEIPMGHAVTLTVVRIHPKEWFKTDGGHQMAGTAISRIAGAMGVSTVSTQMLAYDPTGYCRYNATVRYLELNGGFREETKDGTIDLRPSSGKFKTMLEAGKARLAKAQAENWKSLPDPMGQINAKLQFLPQQTETGAYLRACRKLLSIDRSFQDNEIGKPFLCPRLTFTGRTGNPELDRLAFAATVNARLGGAAALFGPRPVPQALPASAQIHQLPPMSQYVDDGFDDHVEVPAARSSPRPTDTARQPESEEEDPGFANDDIPY